MVRTKHSGNVLFWLIVAACLGLLFFVALISTAMADERKLPALAPALKPHIGQLWTGEFLFSIFDQVCIAMGTAPATNPGNRRGNHVFTYCKPVTPEEADG